MSVPAPRNSIRHSGIHEVFASISLAIANISKVDQYSAIITNPNSSNEARAAAYLDFAAVSKDLGNVSGPGKAMADEVDAKLKTYLRSLTIPQLNFHDNQATVWDVINAINTGDTSHDFTAFDTPKSSNRWALDNQDKCDLPIPFRLNMYRSDAQMDFVSAGIKDMLANVIPGRMIAVPTDSSNISFADLMNTIHSLSN